jgi:2-methylcitrate dehydratase PrpD
VERMGGAGKQRAWGPVEAAAANAAISHFWEFDDSHRSAMMHPGITVLPAVLALAQARPETTVADLRAAVVAGYEAGLRMGAHLGKAHSATNHTTAARRSATVVSGRAWARASTAGRTVMPGCIIAERWESSNSQKWLMAAFAAAASTGPQARASPATAQPPPCGPGCGAAQAEKAAR